MIKPLSKARMMLSLNQRKVFCVKYPSIIEVKKPANQGFVIPKAKTEDIDELIQSRKSYWS